MSDANFISKTRLKKQAHELQDLGKALVRLHPEQLARLELPQELREAIAECQPMTKHEAVRRQMQYIGRIMRAIDAGPIAAQLDALHAPTRRQTALFHRAEEWRARILADPESLQHFVADYPEADPHRIRDLAQEAGEERRDNLPPRRYRELFQLISAIVREHHRKHP
jgi:ribosome-associated protein